MKFSKPVLFFGCAGLGLTLAYSQQSNSAAQQKALDALHQTLAGQGTPGPAPAAAPAAPRSTASTPSRDQLLADVERLHNEGRISDQQYASFKKNIQEQYANTTPTQSQALAQKALAQKIQQLKTGMTAPVPATTQPAPVAPAVAAAPVTTQTQPKPAPKPAPPVATKAPAPQPAPAAVAAPVAVVAAPAPAKTLTPQRTNTVPATTYSTLSPQQEAQAREILRQKIAETNSQVPPPKAAAAPAVTATPRPTPQPAPARVVAAPVVTAQPAPAASAPVTAAAAPAPTPIPGAQAKALETYRDYYIIGIPPETPQLVRILRVKIAESNGVITLEESRNIQLASRFYGPSPWAVAAANPKTEIPFPTNNPQGLAQLDQLNTLYRSNLISPGDYHQQRARIIATL